MKNKKRFLGIGSLAIAIAMIAMNAIACTTNLGAGFSSEEEYVSKSEEMAVKEAPKGLEEARRLIAGMGAEDLKLDRLPEESELKFSNIRLRAYCLDMEKVIDKTNTRIMDCIQESDYVDWQFTVMFEDRPVANIVVRVTGNEARISRVGTIGYASAEDFIKFAELYSDADRNQLCVVSDFYEDEYYIYSGQDGEHVCAFTDDGSQGYFERIGFDEKFSTANNAQTMEQLPDASIVLDYWRYYASEFAQKNLNPIDYDDAQ